jgi:hypothetical protein
LQLYHIAKKGESQKVMPCLVDSEHNNMFKKHVYFPLYRSSNIVSFDCELVKVFISYALPQTQDCQFNIDACTSCGEKLECHTKAASEKLTELKKQIRTQTNL